MTAVISDNWLIERLMDDPVVGFVQLFIRSFFGVKFCLEIHTEIIYTYTLDIDLFKICLELLN